MVKACIKNQVKKARGEKAIGVIKQVGELATTQNDGSTVDNLLSFGKRALVVTVVAVVATQVVVAAVGTVVAHKAEEKRVEKIVRRILEEERQEQEAAQ